MLNLKKPEEFIGSPCKYYVFRFFTIIQLLIGLGTLITAILVLINLQSIDWYCIGYILTGSILFLLSFFSHSTYSSTTRLIIFLTILFICFCSELGLTLAIYIEQPYAQQISSEQTTIAEYTFTAASGALFLEFVLGSWYLSSIRDAEMEKETLRLLNNN